MDPSQLTPFDIIEPPPGALIPSFAAWIALTALVIGGYTLSKIISKKRRASPLGKTLSALLDEAKKIAARADSPAEIERLARLLRRIVSQLVMKDVSALTPIEIKQLAISLKNSADSKSQPTDEHLQKIASNSSILNILSELEEHAYSPLTKSESSAITRTIITRLIDVLESHLRRFASI